MNMSLGTSIPFTAPSAGSLSSIDSLANTNLLAGGNADQLQAVGQEFESIFFSMLLKEMRNSIDSSGEGGLFPGEKSDTLGSLFDLYLGQHLASSNSLGISRAVSSYLANKETQD